MGKFASIGIILSTAVTLAATPALAARKHATITGVIDSGTDENGIFGAANGDLAGKTYTFFFDYDTSACCRDTDPAYDSIENYNADTMELSNIFSYASVAVDGITYQVGKKDSQTVSVTYGDNDGTTLGYHFTSRGRPRVLPVGAINATDEVRALNMRAVTPLLNENILSNTPGTLSFTTNNSQDFRFTNTLVSNSGIGVTNFYVASGTLLITDAVPEPANWAMMIAGFGLIGAIQRRRRLSPGGVAA